MRHDAPMRRKRAPLGISDQVFTSPITWSDKSFPDREHWFIGVEFSLLETSRRTKMFGLMNQQSVFAAMPGTPSRERFCPDDWTTGSAAATTSWGDDERDC